MRFFRSWLIAALVGLPICAQNKEDWPQFRGPTGMGVTSQEVPTTWSERENVVWKTDLPGPGSSSPVIFGKRIYMTCYTGYNMPRV